MNVRAAGPAGAVDGIMCGTLHELFLRPNGQEMSCELRRAPQPECEAMPQRRSRDNHKGRTKVLPIT
jgi:hypothetical protein